MSPRITLPDGVEPVAAVVGAPGAVVSLGHADAYEPRPVLCLQPMTSADARYQEGRREGLLEAAAHMRSLAAAHADAKLGTPKAILRDLYRAAAFELRLKAGEP